MVHGAPAPAVVQSAPWHPGCTIVHHSGDASFPHYRLHPRASQGWRRQARHRLELELKLGLELDLEIELSQKQRNILIRHIRMQTVLETKISKWRRRMSSVPGPRDQL